MKTSSFYLYSGPGRVSIARTAPRRIAEGFKVYRALAPGEWLFDPAYEDYDAYRERYFREILSPLDPQKVWDELHALAGGHEPVLLCHELLSAAESARLRPMGYAGQDRSNLASPGHARRSSKSEAWCHRRMVAEWFEQVLGVEVAEMVIESKIKADPQLDLLTQG